jgi:3-oxoacyl-[acyl-carrier protein] reductase
VVAVTGAGQGIGPAIVRGLSEPGARVFARDIDLDALAVVRCVPGITMATPDLTNRAAAVAWVREVNGQGAARSTRWCLRRAATRAEQPRDRRRRVQWFVCDCCDKLCLFTVSEAVAPAMTARKRGRMILIAIGAGLGVSKTGIQAYAAT